MDDSPDPSAQRPVTGAGSGRLDSWKEIAAYLGKGVTTAQRWEQEDELPVHRLPHARKGSVFAFKSELDSWRTKRAQNAATPKFEGNAASPGLDRSSEDEFEAGTSNRGRTRRAFLAAGVAALALGAVAWSLPDGFAGRSSIAAGTVAAPFVPRPVANDRGAESWPSLSPDGERLVYQWQREDSSGLYIKPVSGGPALPLAFDDPPRFAKAAFTAWSPRDDRIAFLVNEEGADQDTRGLYVIAASGGSPRRLASIYGTGLCWTPDGRQLAFADRVSTGEPFSIFSTSLETGHRQRLTTPPAGTFGDTRCAFSPDGRRLAVARFASRYQADLIVTPADGEKDRGIERLTHGLSGIQGVAWTPDGAAIVFGAHNGLWLVSSSAEGGGEPTLVAAAGTSASQPTFASGSGRPARLAYQHGIRDVNIWRWKASANGAGTMTSTAASPAWEDHPELSPDGQRMVFASNRTGTNEIWLAGEDGADPKQLTFHNGPVVVTPRWSPDGMRVAFSSQVGANRDIYSVRADGSEPKRLTWEASQDDHPSWSRDGRWIYFRSDRAGVAQIWRMPADGGTPVPVTSGAASQAIESADGTLLYFVRSVDSPGLWSMPVGGGSEKLVAADVKEGFWGVAERGVAFLVADPRSSPRGPTIRFFDFASRSTSALVSLSVKPDRVSAGFAVARDGRTVLWTQIDVSQSDVMVIDPWQQSPPGSR